jgi:hypothetical protein
MKTQNIREVLNFLAAAVFFCIGMLVLNSQYITISSSWDYIVLHMLTVMNGLGLCLVLGLLVKTLWVNRVFLRNDLHDDASEEAGL